METLAVAVTHATLALVSEQQEANRLTRELIALQFEANRIASEQLTVQKAASTRT